MKAISISTPARLIVAATIALTGIGVLAVPTAASAAPTVTDLSTSRLPAVGGGQVHVEVGGNEVGQDSDGATVHAFDQAPGSAGALVDQAARVAVTDRAPEQTPSQRALDSGPLERAQQSSRHDDATRALDHYSSALSDLQQERREAEELRDNARSESDRQRAPAILAEIDAEIRAAEQNRAAVQNLAEQETNSPRVERDARAGSTASTAGQGAGA